MDETSARVLTVSEILRAQRKEACFCEEKKNRRKKSSSSSKKEEERSKQEARFKQHNFEKNTDTDTNAKQKLRIRIRIRTEFRTSNSTSEQKHRTSIRYDTIRYDNTI